ncbi:helix-turn-helix domain-containing protein [Xinfangfangia sp. D13-10-4-6]|uniref:XRE family transcriptional regulator n=1 Tax=Pseudogemmobacter hezensis TaxID=2737662 RepID=UPI001551FE09|nr:helix-turn-helix domain-containing protein [Pseudogemmobacter hezensis]NPD17565.1 helix-turn-helix domain-containing protein [Pseudogemmobacter hezensis]
MIREIRNRQGLTLVELAEMAGVSRSVLNEYELGTKVPNTKRLQQIADALNVDPAELIKPAARPVAVPGRAGAGDEVFLVDDYAKGGGLYHVECPPLLAPSGIVAVEIKGDSMEPVYSEGDLLFYSRATADGVPSEVIGRKVIAQTDDGRVWVKVLKAGTEPGLFHLLSLNPAGRNMHDQRVTWAAPVRLHLPKEFVKRVEA